MIPEGLALPTRICERPFFSNNLTFFGLEGDDPVLGELNPLPLLLFFFCLERSSLSNELLNRHLSSTNFGSAAYDWATMTTIAGSTAMRRLV